MTGINAPKVGRRPGKSTTKEAIKRQATKLFATQGFDRTTIREIADAAGVDPALVMHHFGTKEELLISCMEIPKPPLDAALILKVLPKSKWGYAISKVLLEQLNGGKHSSQLVAMARAATTEPRAAKMIREMYEREMLERIRSADIDHPEIRAGMLSSIAVGLIFFGQVVGYEGFTKASKFQQTQMLSAVIQTALTVKLD
jgi:AcrR family transcriptional regulator